MKSVLVSGRERVHARFPKKALITAAACLLLFACRYVALDDRSMEGMPLAVRLEPVCVNPAWDRFSHGRLDPLPVIDLSHPDSPWLMVERDALSIADPNGVCYDFVLGKLHVFNENFSLNPPAFIDRKNLKALSPGALGCFHFFEWCREDYYGSQTPFSQTAFPYHRYEFFEGKSEEGEPVLQTRSLLTDYSISFSDDHGDILKLVVKNSCHCNETPFPDEDDEFPEDFRVLGKALINYRSYFLFFLPDVPMQTGEGKQNRNMLSIVVFDCERVYEKEVRPTYDPNASLSFVCSEADSKALLFESLVNSKGIFERGIIRSSLTLHLPYILFSEVAVNAKTILYRSCFFDTRKPARPLEVVQKKGFIAAAFADGSYLFCKNPDPKPFDGSVPEAFPVGISLSPNVGAVYQLFSADHRPLTGEIKGGYWRFYDYETDAKHEANPKCFFVSFFRGGASLASVSLETLKTAFPPAP